MRVQLSGLLIGALLLASCDPTSPTSPTGGGSGGGGTTVTSNPKKMVVNGGQGGIAAVGSATAVAPSVLVLDKDNNPVKGVQVQFSVTAGGGQIANPNPITGDAGTATPGTWTLGSTLGANTLTATATDTLGNALVGSPITFNATAVVGPPAQLAFTVQPTNAVAGQNISPTIAVTVQDKFGNTVHGGGTAITLSITGGSGTQGATLLGTKTKNADTSGVALFTNLHLNRTGVNYSLTANANGLSSSLSNSFDITPGTLHQLVFSSQPTPTVVGIAISPQVVVEVQDTMGNDITAGSSSITLAITAGSGNPLGVINGTLTRTTINGIAAYPGLNINKPGSAYSLTATATGLANSTSAAFDVLVGPAAKLAVTGGPVSATAGVAMTALNVQVQDALGNNVALNGQNINAAITSGSGASGAQLFGTANVATNASGAATFSTLVIKKAGVSYTLTVSTTGLPNAFSNAFDVNAAPAQNLAFLVQPAASTAGTSIQPSIVTTVSDSLGNTITSSSASISIAIKGGTGTTGALLSGTVTRSAVNGVATFPGLIIDSSGTSYQLNATSGGLTTASSTPFDIVPGSPALLVLNSAPSSGQAGQTLAATTVKVQDARGNTVVTAGIPVTIGITPGTGALGATLGGTLTKLTNASGTVTFSNLVITKASSGYTLTAASAGMVGAVSSAFTVIPGAAAVLAVTQEPASATAGSAFSPSVKIAISDTMGNAVDTATNTVTLSITGGTGTTGATLSGTKVRAAVNGIATFPGLSIDSAGSSYSITANGAGFASIATDPFDVNPGTASKLVVKVQPTAVELGSVMAPSVQVAVEDALGNVVTSSVDNVTAAVTVGSGTVVGVNVGGTSTRQPTSGIVTFDDLTFDKDGTGFTLSLTAAGLTTAVSGSFDVTNANYIYFSHFNGASYDVWRTKLDGSSQSAITARAMTGDPAPAKNSANGRVAFSDGAYGIQQLYVMNGDGTVQQAINTHSDAGEASWSPDGSTIATRVAAGSPSFGLFTISGTGSDRTQLSGAVDNYPTWSQDGASLALARIVSLHHQLVTMPSAGGTATVLLGTEDTSTANIMVQLGTDTLTGFISDTGFVAFTQGQTSFGQTAWSPDGMRLLVVINVATESHIFAISNLGGGALVPLTNTVADVDKAPTWSPDGTKILFQRTIAGVTRIYSMNADGSSVTQIPGQTGNNFSPSWWN